MRATQEDSPSAAETKYCIRFTLDDSNTLSGEVLCGMYEIQELLSRENQADVYGVKLLGSAQTINKTGHEARAFWLRGLTPSLCRHRVRCMERLLPRSVLQTTRKGFNIVIYKTEQIQDPNAMEIQSGASPTPEPTQVPRAANSPKPNQKPKTEYQRESSRLRQRDRRRKRRQRNSQVTTETTGDDQDVAEIDEDDCTLLRLLTIAQLPMSDSLGRLPEDVPPSVLRHISGQRPEPPVFQNAFEMEAFVKAKESEVSYFRSLLRRVPHALERCNIRLLSQQQATQVDGTVDLTILQRDEIERTEEKLKLLRGAVEALSDHIESATVNIRSVEQAIPGAQQRRRRLEHARLLALRRENLRERVETLRAVICHLVPASPPHTQLAMQLKEAEEDWNKTDKQLIAQDFKVGAHLGETSGSLYS